MAVWILGFWCFAALFAFWLWLGTIFDAITQYHFEQEAISLGEPHTVMDRESGGEGS